MTEFTFYLSDDDFNRLYAIKEIRGRQDLTGNEFARQLLEAELYRQVPAIPQYDEYGNITNVDQYRGGYPCN